MKGFRYLRNVATVGLTAPACIGCGRCLEVCPHQVFAIDSGKAYFVDKDACMECGACARNCPVSALAVNAGVGCAAGIIHEWLQERNLQAPGSGCCS